MLVDLARWFFAAKMKVNSRGPSCTWVILLPAPSVLAERVHPSPCALCLALPHWRTTPRKLSARVFPMKSVASVTNDSSMQSSLDQWVSLHSQHSRYIQKEVGGGGQ